METQTALLTTVFIIAIAVIGLNIMVGYAGLIVLAQGGFMSIGAYTTSQLLAAGFGILPSIFVGGVLAAITSIVFGLPSYRVKGFYIAITTLALQAISEWFFSNNALEWLHGGTQQVLPTEAGLVGGYVTIGDGHSVYYLTLVLLLMTAIFSMNLSRSSTGFTFRAINNNDLATNVLGVSVYKNKLLAFGLGGFFVGLAGGLYAFNLGLVSPAFFEIDLTLEHYIILLVGGLGRVWGAAIGTVIIIYLEDFLRNWIPYIFTELGIEGISPASVQLVLFGLIIIVVLIFEPKGLMAILGKIKEYFRKWPYAY
jgi:branched-chain amino acid transport system permease protein